MSYRIQGARSLKGNDQMFADDTQPLRIETVTAATELMVPGETIQNLLDPIAGWKLISS